jgi:hypothetical protein
MSGARHCVGVRSPYERGEKVATFLALYEGATVSSARLVAVESSPELVREFARRMLDAPEGADPDPVAREIELGRRRALTVIRDEGLAGGGAHSST